ncbi:hypothetical protein BC939DRAFT_528335 [Gamsiella multidivaricata]|uniref:uncharacterized protein n=1 Tax=Gamsiella multidivaricata TaxID=101098 RepID=UPI0022210437|nr:uncharacterized protein BC939DRAFT_528335 [Gamsiella multidivaricata]KAG0368407.1 hypothetical protein BGZ54_001981 [Gamsiella multidivaricata]KAI7824822.1 hypothetical protein BC939DRAFT_528335 [Gamsiella multidivaricata]
MGQNQSIEEPYHRRHYNETHPQIKRQNSLSMSTPNLLLHRDHNLSRGNTFANSSRLSLPRRMSLTLGSSATIGGGTNTGAVGTGNPAPVLRLLPIQNEHVYYDESDDSGEEDIHGEDSYPPSNPHHKEQRRHITASPSFLDGTLHVNSRLNRSDSYEHHPRDRADFQRSKDEEQEDLSYLSPQSASHGLDQDRQQGLDHVGDNVKRYQLYDRPVPAKLLTKVDESEIQDITVSLRPLFLDAIHEVDEDLLGHSRGPSQVAQADRDTSRLGPHVIQPVQERNASSAGQRNNADNDTQPSVEDLYGEVKTVLDRRIQEAVQQVELQLSDRVQRLEEQTGSLSMMHPDPEQDLDSLETLSYHSRGSAALRKDMLSNASQIVEELDDRVNQMEYMVSYKLDDIESKVQELHEGQNNMAQTISEVEIQQGSEQQLSGDTMNELQRYRPPMGNDDSDLEDMDDRRNATALVDKATVMELRQELQAFGMRYHELNDGLLTDLMTQMKEAKLMLFETVDEVDQRLGRRVDRIEAEMHAKLLSDIENRIQERVRAMEQTSVRLERCFDKMEGRLGALETVLASKRSHPENTHRMLEQKAASEPQLQQLQQPALSNRNESPESPVPDRVEKATPPLTATKAIFRSNRSTSSLPAASDSSVSSTYRNNTVRPARIQTSASMNFYGTPPPRPGPHSAGPMPTASRTEQLASQDSLRTSSVPGTGTGDRTLTSHSSFPTSVGLIGPRSAGHVSTSTRTSPTKGIRRPSSYKELLHFWKAGGSSPDLLKHAESKD